MNDYRDYYLAHHGILGQKWGKMHGPPYPLGSDKSTGHRLKIGRKSKKVSGGSNGSNSTTIKKKNQSSQSTVPKKKGLTPQQKKVIRRTLMVAGGLAVGAAASRYIGKEFVGVNIKPGKAFQRIAPEMNLHNEFYASFGKHDKDRYNAFLGNHYGRKNPNVNMFEMVNNKNIKAPSNHQAKKIYKQLLKNNPEFKKLAGDAFRNNYKEFNVGLVGHEEIDKKRQKIFYDEIKKRGFNAVVDINDQNYPGYGTKKPLIMLDKSAVDINKVKKYVFSEERYEKEYKKYNYEMLVRPEIEYILGMVGVYASAAEAADQYSKRKNNKKNSATKTKKYGG